MVDRKTIRRRRAVLGLLVAFALVLITASFGGGGVLGSVQRGANEVLGPVGEGASQALKPVRDLFGWVGDTFSAKGQLEEVRAERDRLRREVVQNQAAAEENARLREQLDINERLSLDQHGLLQTRVIAQSPSVWYAQVQIDKGTGDGVRRDMPVMNGQGLVGHVREATRGAAWVTLITDHSSQVSARVLGGRLPTPGVVTPASAGNPNDLLLEFPGGGRIDPGDRIVTRGTTNGQLPSLYPPNLPIGEVTRVEDPGSDTQEVHLRPFADLRRLDRLQVLTRAATGEDA